MNMSVSAECSPARRGHLFEVGDQLAGHAPAGDSISATAELTRAAAAFAGVGCGQGRRAWRAF